MSLRGTPARAAQRILDLAGPDPGLVGGVRELVERLLGPDRVRAVGDGQLCGRLSCARHETDGGWAILLLDGLPCEAAEIELAEQLAWIYLVTVDGGRSDDAACRATGAALLARAELAPESAEVATRGH